MTRIGLALGGGGVRGFAHIPVLELLDDLGLKPSFIAGTSMGALIGALYASGMPGRQIRSLVEEHLITHERGRRARIRWHRALLRWVGPLRPGFKHGGVIQPDRFLKQLLGGITRNRFEDLETPLAVIASDFWTGEEVVFSEGELLPAIRASVAIPGVFPPLPLGGRILVDGGLVNVVPYDHLVGQCDVAIAVDVGRSDEPDRTDLPHFLDSVLGAFDIMQAAALETRLAVRAPDIYVRARTAGIRILDFAKAEAIFEQTRPAVEELRRRLVEMGIAGAR
jgi:NTE family protein